jgi:hypothetical protein
MRLIKELFEFETGSLGHSERAALRKICLTVRTFAARVFSHFSFPRLAHKFLLQQPLTAFGLHRCPASVSNACDILLNNYCEPAFAVLNRLHRHEAVVTYSRRTILAPHPGCKKCVPPMYFSGIHGFSAWQAFATFTHPSCSSLQGQPMKWSPYFGPRA